MYIDSPLTELKGVGKELSAKLSQLGLKTAGDLIEHFPRRYEDYSKVEKIKDIKPGAVTIKAAIKQASGKYVRRGLHVTEAIAADETGSVRLVWFNQPYRAKNLKKGSDYYISGEFGLSRQRLSIQNPSAELTSSFQLSTARIVPVYKSVKGIKSHQIRKLIGYCLPIIKNLEESLPEWVIKERSLMSRSRAIEMLHFPEDKEQLLRSRKRLGFEEVFELTLAALLNKRQFSKEEGVSIEFDQELAKEFVKNLPFDLTDAQKKAVWQIFLDMQKIQPMNRLLEGDVGSGKTVVAAMASAMAVKHGYQAAVMAPTEILARQHSETMFDLLRPLGMAEKVCLLVGGLAKAQKTKAYESIKTGRAKIIIGTHALIQEAVDMHKLGLIIVDEQHRFGVRQRKMLQAKAGHMPHVLAMTATPIPRSLALTLYGELDISIIDTKPAGRSQIETEICSPNSRKQLYEKVASELKDGRKMFVVCPLISDSNGLDVMSAEKMHEQLSKIHLKNWKIGLLHGRMKPEEKDEIMRKFIDKELDVLVSTTVIEVGVDVPNATVMIIENAERFGLAQIHQLRGRVGRSVHQGYCYLMMGDSSAPSRRLRALEQMNDGFKLAELDLELRGPGAIYGTLQHGALDLRIAKLSDVRLIASARKAAGEFIARGERLSEYKKLNRRVKLLRAVTNLN